MGSSSVVLLDAINSCMKMSWLPLAAEPNFWVSFARQILLLVKKFGANRQLKQRKPEHHLDIESYASFKGEPK